MIDNKDESKCLYLTGAVRFVQKIISIYLMVTE
jgi:hypothetical protein